MKRNKSHHGEGDEANAGTDYRVACRCRFQSQLKPAVEAVDAIQNGSTAADQQKTVCRRKVGIYTTSLYVCGIVCTRRLFLCWCQDRWVAAGWASITGQPRRETLRRLLYI